MFLLKGASFIYTMRSFQAYNPAFLLSHTISIVKKLWVFVSSFFILYFYLKYVTLIRAVLLISAFVPVTNPGSLQTQPNQDVSCNHQEEPDQLGLFLLNHTKNGQNVKRDDRAASQPRVC